MAGMFYTMQEVADKLGKSEDQIRELVQEGKLREFRDGTKLLFKTSEVDAIVASPAPLEGEPIEITPNDSQVVPEHPAKPAEAAAPTPSTPEIPDILLSDDGDDDLLLIDEEQDDTQEPAPVEEVSDDIALEGFDLSESSLPSDELSLEDSLDLLMSESNGNALPSENIAIAEDDSIDILADTATPETEEPAKPEASADDSLDIIVDNDTADEAASDDSLDILITDDAEGPAVEAASDDSSGILIEDDAARTQTPDETEDILLADDDTANILLDASDSIKLVDETALDAGSANDDSFDILLEDDTSDKAPAKDGSLISDDTLSGIIGDEKPDDELLSSLTKADTAMGNTGINVLSESDGDFQLASDTKADTVIPEDEDDFDLDLDSSDGGDFLAESTGLGNLDDDINLDSIGSGSGLLDLSLQADDTSLGAVLDDILPASEEPEAAPMEIDEGSIIEEAEQIFEDSPPAPLMPSGHVGGAAAQRFAEPEPTAVDNACGIALFLPALLIVYAAMVTIFGLKGISPAMLTQVTAEVGGIPMIWLIAIGASVLFLLILMIAALMGGGSGEKKEKPVKVKKAKKPKAPKKKKKEKKKKK